MATSYGAQANGLICGYRFTPAEGGQAIDLSQALDWLAKPAGEPAEFMWLHFDLTDASAQAWMQAHLALTDEFFDALRLDSRSTRIEDAQDNLVAVVNDVAYEFAFDPSEIATLWMSVSPRVAVSARKHPLRSIDRLREAVNAGARFGSSVDLLNHLMRDQGDVLVRIVREATLKVDAIEDSLLRGKLKHQRAALGKLRRVLVRLQRLLAPEPAALFRLLRQPPPWIPATDLDELRQATEEFSLVIRDLAALQERIKLLQEEIAAQVSEQTNRSLFTLTMVTVLALPINITTGFFGMNVGGIPFAEFTHGFVSVVMILGRSALLVVAESPLIVVFGFALPLLCIDAHRLAASFTCTHVSGTTTNGLTALNAMLTAASSAMPPRNARAFRNSAGMEIHPRGSANAMRALCGRTRCRVHPGGGT